jgi:hypothetical protein
MQRATWFFMMIIVVTAVFISSCSKNDGPTAPAGGATSYIGTVGNSAEAGALSLTFASAPPKLSPGMNYSITTIINVSGTVKFGGTTITLTGTYNTTNDSLIVSGGGYSFMGILANGTLSGTYTGPNGSGSFTTEGSTEAGSVKVYIGTSHETSPDTSNHGRFLLVVKGTAVTGITDSGEKLGGTISGTHVSIHFISAPSVEIAQGTVSTDGTTMSGTYSATSGEGTFSGTWTCTLQ